MISELAPYAADGLEMQGQLYRDPAQIGPRPGVLVFPDAMGLSDHTTGCAERLARLGLPLWLATCMAMAIIPRICPR